MSESKSEDIEPLPMESAVDRVLDLDDAKTYRVETTVLILDDYVPSYGYAGAAVLFKNPVPVYSDEGRGIGFAALSVTGRAVEAEIFLRYDTNERFLLETKSQPLYINVPQMVSGSNTDTGIIKVEAVVISRLYITTDPNVDDRLGPL
jgi:hypothetical protein